MDFCQGEHGSRSLGGSIQFIDDEKRDNRVFSDRNHRAVIGFNRAINTYRDRESRQDIYVEWLTPEADEVVIEIDISLLEEYGTIEGVTVESLNKSRNSEEPMVWGATLDGLTIDDWTISVKLVPDPGTNYTSVGVQLGGLNLTIGDPVRDVSYDMTIEEDVDETVETESFDIVDDRPDDDANDT